MLPSEHWGGSITSTTQHTKNQLFLMSVREEFDLGTSFLGARCPRPWHPSGSWHHLLLLLPPTSEILHTHYPQAGCPGNQSHANTCQGCHFTREGCMQPSPRLTCKVAGRQRTLFSVPGRSAALSANLTAGMFPRTRERDEERGKQKGLGENPCFHLT